MKKQIISSILGVAAFCAGNLALADTIVINQTVAVTTNGSNIAVAVSDFFSPSIAVQVGDTVDLTLTLPQGQALSVTSAGGNQVFNAAIDQDTTRSSPNGSIFTVENARLDFIGLRGPFPSTLTLQSQSSGFAQIGASFGTDVLGIGQTMSFTGLHATFLVTALNENLRYYNYSHLTVLGDSVALVSAVPEPETYAMLVAGLGVLALARRRKAALAV